jgi:hypothetical protein
VATVGARIVAFAVAAAVVVVLPGASAGAKTTVKVNGNDVVVKVSVDCVGCTGRKAPDGKTDLAKYWEKTAEDAWNAAFAKFSYCNKYKLELDVDIKARGDSFDSTRGRHRILVGEPGSGLNQTGWDGVFEPTPGGDPGQRSPDGTRYFEQDGDGSMGTDATPTVIVHEFGHVIGLGDDRDAAGNALPNSGTTIMIGGSRLPDGTVVTENTKLTIDQKLINRIGDQLATLGKIKCGETWRGSIEGIGDNVGYCQSTDFSGDIVIRVREDDSAALSGHLTTADSGGCSGGHGERVETDFRLDGTKTRRAFRFAESPLFPWPVNLTISGDRASGTTSKMFGPIYLTTLDFDARCCEDGRGVG